MRNALLPLLVFILAACSSVAITAEEERWCTTSQGALAFDFFAETFESVHGIPLVEAKAEFGYKEQAGEQVGSRMTITERGGFPDAESRAAWYASDLFVEACRVAYDTGA